MFTDKELSDMLLSIVVMGFLFSFMPGFLPGGSPWLLNLISAILLSGLVWTLHVAAQKVFARRYECKVMYFLSPHLMLISISITLFLALASYPYPPLILVAVGFINVSTKYTTRLGYKFVGLTVRETGQVALIGWVANVLLALLLKVLQPLSPPFFSYFMGISLWVALFNLLPIPPLDGSKVMSWNIAVWMAALAISIALTIALPLLGLAESIAIFLVVFVLAFLIMQQLVPKPTGSGYAP